MDEYTEKSMAHARAQATIGGMAIGMGQLNAVKETPLTRLSFAVDRLRKANAAVADAATILVGEQMTGGPANQMARAPVGSGMLGSIEELADSVTDIASDIVSNISRIQSRL